MPFKSYDEFLTERIWEKLEEIDKDINESLEEFNMLFEQTVQQQPMQQQRTPQYYENMSPEELQKRFPGRNVVVNQKNPNANFDSALNTAMMLSMVPMVTKPVGKAARRGFDTAIGGKKYAADAAARRAANKVAKEEFAKASTLAKGGIQTNVGKSVVSQGVKGTAPKVAVGELKTAAPGKFVPKVATGELKTATPGISQSIANKPAQKTGGLGGQYNKFKETKFGGKVTGKMESGVNKSKKLFKGLKKNPKETLGAVKNKAISGAKGAAGSAKKMAGNLYKKAGYMKDPRYRKALKGAAGKKLSNLGTTVGKYATKGNLLKGGGALAAAGGLYYLYNRYKKNKQKKQQLAQQAVNPAQQNAIREQIQELDEMLFILEELMYYNEY